jgi:hypothetical protein
MTMKTKATFEAMHSRAMRWGYAHCEKDGVPIEARRTRDGRVMWKAAWQCVTAAAAKTLLA